MSISDYYKVHFSWLSVFLFFCSVVWRNYQNIKPHHGCRDTCTWCGSHDTILLVVWRERKGDHVLQRLMHNWVLFKLCFAWIMCSQWNAIEVAELKMFILLDLHTKQNSKWILKAFVELFLVACFLALTVHSSVLCHCLFNYFKLFLLCIADGVLWTCIWCTYACCLCETRRGGSGKIIRTFCEIWILHIYCLSLSLC